eukprot:m51a1_g4276 hypothetical protein (2122) ;mRNA; r:318708-331603
MHRSAPPRLLLLLLLLLLNAPEAAARGWSSQRSPCAAVSHALYPNSTAAAGDKPLLVVGQSAPFTGPHARTGTDVRAGLEAAFASANEASLVRFVLASLDDAYDDGRQASNTQQLICSGANGTGPAFLMAGSVGSSASEAALGTLLASAGSDGVPVPFVGALTSSEKLRARASVMPGAGRADSARAGVVLARASGGDEVGAIVSFLTDSWSYLNHTSVFYQDTQFARDAFGLLSSALRSNGGRELLSSAHSGVVTTQSDLSAMAVKAADALCVRSCPRAVVLLALGSMSAALVQEMARRNKGDIRYVAMSFVSPEELYAALPQSTWEMADSQGSTLFFTQIVPLPRYYHSKYRIVTEYQKAMQKYQPGVNYTHASLEGFIAGRLVMEATSRALELNGWPLTRATFLDAIFRDIRTFKLYGSYTLGPYGDGVGTTEAAQTEDDWCNQGAHEVFMTQMLLPWGDMWPVDSWSFKFSGCSSRWNDTSPKSLVGFFITDTVDWNHLRIGLAAAASAHNSDSSRPVALTAAHSAVIDAAFDKFRESHVVAIAALAEQEVNRSLELIKKGELLIPLIAPFSGLRVLRGVINLFASYYQEARTAASFLVQRHNAGSVIVLWNSQTHHDAGKDIVDGLAICLAKRLLGVERAVAIEDRPFQNVTQRLLDYVVAKAKDGASFIVVADVEDAWQLLKSIRGASRTCPVVLTSVMGGDDLWETMSNESTAKAWTNVYSTTVTPQLDSLSSGNALRQEFESWVSVIDQLQVPLDGFLVGRFISAVLDSMNKDDLSSDGVTADTLLKAIYTKKYFKINKKITVGPFLDQNSGERLCNQGMDTVYLSEWDGSEFRNTDFTIREDRRCGKEFDPEKSHPSDHTERTVILSITIPSFVVVCSLLIVAIVMRSIRKTPLKKLKRSELEIGERIGKGHLGTVHNGDWHGTPVAVRVIDKTAVTREGLEAVKSEIALTHSLHHPNLLMLLGFSESNTDLLIVSEYMASGSLHEYLKKNKQNMNYYNDVAIAFVCNSTQKVVMVVGQSAPFSGPHRQAGIEVRAGFEAAFAAANQASPVRFVLVPLDDAYDGTRQASNTQALLCSGANGTGSAFAIVGSVGSSASEATLATLLSSEGSDGVPVPYIGGLTGSELLRTRSAVLQNASASGSLRSGVALARPGAGDEVSAIVSLLSSSWSVLNRTSVFFQDTPFGRDAVQLLREALASSGGAALLSSYGHAVVASQSAAREVARKAADALCTRGDPRAVVLLAVGSMSGALIREMSERNKTGVQYVAMSFVTAGELRDAAPQSAWVRMMSQSVSVYISQVVPMPYDSHYSITGEFRSSMRKYQPLMNVTHTSLEGYIAGRLLTTAASRALELYGWPLTRARFLDAIFRDIRTFRLHCSYTLGPYGDGVGSSSASQMSEDWCNQGAHEVFMTQMDLYGGELQAAESWSFKWSGCSVAGASNSTHKAVVGYDYTRSRNSGDMQLGMAAALSAHNSESGRLVALSTEKTTDVATAVARFTTREAVALAGLAESEVAGSLDLMGTRKQLFPLFAPLSGLQKLRTPFRRDVVNLFASYYQEAQTAASFLINRESVQHIVVIWNSDTHSEVATDFLKGLDLCRNRNLLGVNLTDKGISISDRPFVNITQEVTHYIATEAEAGHAFVVVASAEDAWALMQHMCCKSPVVLTSSVSYGTIWQSLFWDDNENHTWVHVYRTSLMPQLDALSTGNAMRQDFESWVSLMDQQQGPFEGYFVGRFLSAVVQSMDEGNSGTEITAETLLDAVYAKRYFKVGNKITVGPFLDQSSGERLCNQGMDTVYVTKWDVEGNVFDYVSYAIQENRRCGKEFDPPEIIPNENTDRIVILSTTIPAFVVVCSLLATAIVFIQRRGRPTLKKLKRRELEIGERIGKGQFGTVHNGDWHGTPVAIRVIDKMAITREDLGAIKSEMALTHSLHHPNLLMLLGYSESKTDLLIVSEYMASGSLHDYLKKNKQNMNYYNEVAIAFSGPVSESQRAVSEPEIPPSTPKEVAALLMRCWLREPERRPSVFQILQNWPKTFASIGVFEMPSDLSVTSSPQTPGNMLSESTDARDVSDDVLMAAVLPQDLAMVSETPTLGRAGCSFQFNASASSDVPDLSGGL